MFVRQASVEQARARGTMGSPLRGAVRLAEEGRPESLVRLLSKREGEGGGRAAGHEEGLLEAVIVK
jgi:hypothetical protein